MKIHQIKQITYELEVKKMHLQNNLDQESEMRTLLMKLKISGIDLAKYDEATRA